MVARGDYDKSAIPPLIDTLSDQSPDMRVLYTLFQSLAAMVASAASLDR